MYFQWIEFAFIFIFGACVGSFLNVCIYRIPAGKSLITPQSHCPSCLHSIPWYFNLPIFGWIILSGKCWNCKNKISSRYIIVESITGLIFCLIYLRFNNINEFMFYSYFASVLIVVIYVDFETMKIPDVLTIPSLSVGILYSVLWGGGLYFSIIGATFGFISFYAVVYIYFIITGKVAMGGGDIKMMAMIGSFLGWKSVPFVVFLSSILGILYYLGVRIILSRNQQKMPYGPFLAMAALVYVFAGDFLIESYLVLVVRE